MVAAKYVQLPSTLKQKSWSWNASRMNPFEGRRAGCCHPILNNHCPSNWIMFPYTLSWLKHENNHWNHLVIIYEPWTLPLNPMTWSCPLDLLAWKVLELLFFPRKKRLESQGHERSKRHAQGDIQGSWFWIVLIKKKWYILLQNPTQQGLIRDPQTQEYNPPIDSNISWERIWTPKTTYKTPSQEVFWCIARFAIITWNNPKKLEKPYITKGQYLSIFRLDFPM